ncbi:MAG TPA: cyclopropane fatty acyl phospholipid synthase [Steroidobacteraceae bacterium]|jgi:cyclopropane-fatty-acyl-phospholipid synthase|nr:cyclopropane fatty acyl phospholipid synthase [Steroidobacteraceae bacterium]
MKRAAYFEHHSHDSPAGRFRRRIERLFAECGIDIDGPNAWDIQVHNEDFYARVLAKGSLGLGESYMDGWWDVRDLDGFVYRLLAARADERARSWRDALAWLGAALVNHQRGARVFEVARRHYDLGNEFYEAMLDRRMIYSCAYWEGAHTLDDAQEAKLALVLDKLAPRPAQRLLDVGCGWGGALKFAAERYGVTGVGVTIAREQAAYARESCRDLPVAIRLQDYREMREKFDHVFSIGMFEHVGVRNYRRYMKVVRRCLHPGGRFLLHTIGGFRSTNHTDAWIGKYIFPNSMIPSREQIERAIDGIFGILHWQSIGANYERTLLAWRSNLERSWSRLAGRYDERFRRMWHYYLSSCAAAFRARKLDVWQILLSPE